MPVSQLRLSVVEYRNSFWMRNKHALTLLDVV
jgi:hypothetical protein